MQNGADVERELLWETLGRNTYTLPVMWDAHMVKTFLECPRKFQLSILEHWSAPSNPIDLEFGRLVHSALETFFNKIVSGATHDEAVKTAVRHILEESWDHESNKPRMGFYADLWRCQGTEKYRNEKGNLAKCPYSHKGKLFPIPAPDICGSCGSATEIVRQWIPQDKAKDRFQAVRVLVWFAEEFREHGLGLVTLQNEGKPPQPMTEVFWRASVGADKFCGNIDALFAIGDETFIVDYKTTRGSIGGGFFMGFDPSTQIEFYNSFRHSIGNNLNLNIAGVMVIGIQVMQGGVRFGIGIVRQSKAKLKEFAAELASWKSQAEQWNELGFWPRNTASCFRCPFKTVCSAEPSARPSLLAEHFVRSRWDPAIRERIPVETDNVSQ